MVFTPAPDVPAASCAALLPDSLTLPLCAPSRSDDRPNGGWHLPQWLRILARKRAIDWLCNWHTRDSVTSNTAAISFRFMSCS